MRTLGVCFAARGGGGGRSRGHRDGRTKLYVAGYEYTRANITNVKISYRCSYYRSQMCQGKLEFHVQVKDYDFDRAVPHTCTPPTQPLLQDDMVTRDF